MAVLEQWRAAFTSMARVMMARLWECLNTWRRNVQWWVVFSVNNACVAAASAAVIVVALPVELIYVDNGSKQICTADGISVASTIVKFSSKGNCSVWRCTQPCQWISTSLTSSVVAAITSGRCGTSNLVWQWMPPRWLLQISSFPPWLRQRATAGHSGEKPLLTASGSERSCQSCLSGAAFLHCNWSTPLPSLAANTTENWLQDCQVTYNVRQTNTPVYMASLISDYIPSRTLLSSDKLLLSQPATTLTFSQKTFAFGSPTIWNRLQFLL